MNSNATGKTTLRYTYAMLHKPHFRRGVFTFPGVGWYYYRNIHPVNGTAWDGLPNIPSLPTIIILGIIVRLCRLNHQLPGNQAVSFP